MKSKTPVAHTHKHYTYIHTYMHACMHTYRHRGMESKAPCGATRLTYQHYTYMHTCIHTDIETWKVRRPVVQPGFHAQWLKRMCVTFNECAQVCMFVCIHVCVCLCVLCVSHTVAQKNVCHIQRMCTGMYVCVCMYVCMYLR